MNSHLHIESDSLFKIFHPLRRPKKKMLFAAEALRGGTKQCSTTFALSRILSCRSRRCVHIISCPIQEDGPTSHTESPHDLGLHRCRAATLRARPLPAGPSARFATAATPSRMSRGQTTSMMAPWSRAWSRRAALPGARTPTPYTSESKAV